MRIPYFLFLLVFSNAFLSGALLADAPEKAFDGVQPLTEAEEKESKNYIHKGIVDRKHYEMCANNQEKCTSEEAFEDGDSMKKVEDLMPMIKKAYAFFTFQDKTVSVKETKNGKPVKYSKDGKQEYSWQEGEDGEGHYADKNGEPLPEGAETKDTKERMDICGKLPAVIETASMAYQMTNNEQTKRNYENAPPGIKQKAGFEALAKMHDDRSSAAEKQAAGWGAVSACYIADAAAFGAVKDWKLIAKIAASGLITKFYLDKKDAHKDKARALKRMAAKFPSPGDCNPHTETTCFCSEETSYASDPENYMKYCVPPELHREGNVAGYSCVDKNGKADVSCKCKKNNSCISARIAQDALKLGLNPAAMKDPLAGIGPLNTGKGSAGLEGIARRNLAMAQKELKDFRPKENLRIGSKKGKKLAEGLLSAGIPKAAAAALAKGAGDLDDATPPGLGSSLASLPDPSNGDDIFSSSYNRGKNQMKSGNAVKEKSKSRRRSNPFARRRRSNSRSATSSVDIMDFAQKASKEAQIAKDKSRPIFEIITYRYKMRAWKEFKNEMRQHMDAEEKK